MTACLAFAAVFWIEFALVRLFTTADFQLPAALLAMGVLICTDVAFYVIAFGTFKIKKAFAGLSLTNRQLYANYALKLGTLVVTLAADSGTQMASVVVTMGGDDITSTAYDSATNTITIASVTEYTNATQIVNHPTTNYIVCASNYVNGVTNTVPYSAPIWGFRLIQFTTSIHCR